MIHTSLEYWELLRPLRDKSPKIQKNFGLQSNFGNDLLWIIHLLKIIRCFTDASLQPRLINGWFWSGSGVKIPSTDKTPPGWSANPWGTTGIYTQVYDSM